MNSTPRRLPLLQLLICSSLILTLSMGVRHGFGLWLQPVTQDQGWTRESFAFAIALQNLSWGLLGIVAGMLADRWGGLRVLLGGALLWALGLCGMALAQSELGFALSAGLLIGAAQAASTYTVIYGILGRQIAPERRSWAMGLTAAAGSFGQFLMVPTEGWLISSFGCRLSSSTSRRNSGSRAPMRCSRSSARTSSRCAASRRCCGRPKRYRPPTR